MVSCDFQGHFLPLFGKSEMEWPNWIRIVLYSVGLSWCFLGIALISDIFMSAIEKITSAKKRVADKKTGRTFTVFVWNPTVANLTLMALGSSAPEILLSCIEILGNNMFIGELGAGVIVGSAAFNLLIISAVCICSIPGQDVRKIKEVPVYIITASTSVFAYIWLMFILMVTSPDVCEIWEGVLTFLFFPVLVVAAFLAEKGYFTGDHESKALHRHTISKSISKDELARIEQNIRQLHGASLTDEQVVKFIEHEYMGKPTRAVYHLQALSGLWGKNKKVAMESSALVCTPTITTDEIRTDKQHKTVTLGFKTPKIAVLENCETAKLVVFRGGFRDCAVTVKYATSDGTAVAESDYEKVGPTTLEFKPGETEKEVFIKIVNDAAYEEDEWFFVDLSEPTCDGVGCQVQMRDAKATVVIIDDDLPGQLRFTAETMDVTQDIEDKVVNIVVERFDGATGTIGCSYRTEEDSAVAKFDFEESSGKLEFSPGTQTASFPVTIKATGRYERKERFRVILEEPYGHAKFDEKTDGGAESCVLTIYIQASVARRATIDKIASGINWNKMSVGTSNWKDQFVDAVWLQSEDGVTVMEVLLHVVSVPWKAIFALVPPTDYCSGWLSFGCSLVFIAGMTALVGDMANLVGCTLGIEGEITAITLVALGTSMPDTFASKTAAAIDEHADASIGNITGSNAVNVFLGLGMPWTMAAIYWASAGRTDQWLAKIAPGGLYSDVADSVKGFSGAVFVVPAGTLWFNLMVFSLNAGCAISHLYLRRRKYGGELGGPRKKQYFSAAFLLAQWVIYVGLSSMWVTIQKNK